MPTPLDMWALAVRLGEPEPLQIVNHPVEMHVLRLSDN